MKTSMQFKYSFKAMYKDDVDYTTYVNQKQKQETAEH